MPIYSAPWYLAVLTPATRDAAVNQKMKLKRGVGGYITKFFTLKTGPPTLWFFTNIFILILLLSNWVFHFKFTGFVRTSSPACHHIQTHKCTELYLLTGVENKLLLKNPILCFLQFGVYKFLRKKIVF